MTTWPLEKEIFLCSGHAADFQTVVIQGTVAGQGFSQLTPSELAQMKDPDSMGICSYRHRVGTSLPVLCYIN